MTEEEWRSDGQHAQTMLRFLLEPGKMQRTKAGKRKLRLFACGCCRLIWDQLNDPLLRGAVAVAERFADGEAREVERAAMLPQLIGLTHGGYNPGDPGVEERTAAHMALSCTTEKAASAALDMTSLPLPLAGHTREGRTGSELLGDLIRCIFGNPFRSTALNSTWLPSTVLQLASGIYSDRAFDRMPILADALQDAGCEDAAILDHCRDPKGAHVRGCWVVDLLLQRA